MKNKFNKILLIISCVVVVLIVVLAILGSFSRKGYLSEFKLLSSKNGNYTYTFRIKYYSKIFKNSDIYGVYIDIDKLIKDNNFIKSIKMNDNKGTPFGELISSKRIDFDKIDNVNYNLKIKYNYLIYIIVTIIIFYILYSKRDYIYSKNKNNVVFKIYLLVFVLFSISIMFLSMIGNIKKDAYLNNFFMIDKKSNHDNTELYYYNFKLNYNKPLIYSLNHYIWYEKEYIKDIKITDYVNNYGTLTSSKKLEYNDVENVSYTLDIRKELIYLFFLMLFMIPLLYIYLNFTNPLKKDYIFINESLMIAIVLFIFHYWLLFPGFLFEGDTWVIMNAGVDGVYDNWHPVFFADAFLSTIWFIWL